MSRHRFTRRRLDEWITTVSRYVGLGMMMYAVFIDKGANPALIPAATGLIFLKNVMNGRGE